MQSLGHASIFCTSNPRGQTTFCASYVLSGNSLSFGSIFFIITNNFPNPLSDTPFSVFHCSNSSVVPNFFCQLRNSDTTISCDPLTCAATSSSPNHLRSFSLHRQWPDLDHQRAHLMPLLLASSRIAGSASSRITGSASSLIVVSSYSGNPWPG